MTLLIAQLGRDAWQHIIMYDFHDLHHIKDKIDNGKVTVMFLVLITFYIYQLNINYIKFNIII